jgi:hypothetical protein
MNKVNKEDKKPDSYVENAKLLSYGSNIGAPSIKIENIDGWKQYNALKVNKVFQSKYEELKNEYLKFIEEYEWNSLIYSAQYNFEPVVGETYHLYKRNNDEYFLSIISPEDWEREFIGSFRLDTKNKWNKI